MILKYFLLLIYLTICTYTDIKTKTISLFNSAGFAISIFILGCITDTISLKYILLQMLPGFFLILLSLIKPNSIGLGDGIIFLIVGLSTSLIMCLNILLITLLLSSIYSILLLLRHYSKKYIIPLAPFILLSSVFVLLRSWV